MSNGLKFENDHQSFPSSNNKNSVFFTIPDFQLYPQNDESFCNTDSGLLWKRLVAVYGREKSPSFLSNQSAIG